MSRRGWAIAFGAVLVSRGAGHLFSPLLLVHAPLVLLASSPFLAHLVITAPLVPPLAFAAVAGLVSVVHVSVGFQFGRANGPAVVRWLETALPGTGRQIDRLLVWLARAAPLVVVAVPGPLVATLAGATGLTPRRFYGPMLFAQVAWTWGAYALGEQLEPQLVRVRDAVAVEVLPLTLVLLLAGLLRRVRAASRTPPMHGTP